MLVADAFDAITSDRPYRAGRSPQEAIRELRAGAGSQFDPACVQALVDLLAASQQEPPAAARSATAG